MKILRLTSGPSSLRWLRSNGERRKETKKIREGTSTHCSSGELSQGSVSDINCGWDRPTLISWKPVIGLTRILQTPRRAEKNAYHPLSLVSNSLKHSVACLSHTVNLVMQPAILHTHLFSFINVSSTLSVKTKSEWYRFCWSLPYGEL